MNDMLSVIFDLSKSAQIFTVNMKGVSVRSSKIVYLDKKLKYLLQELAWLLS